MVPLLGTTGTCQEQQYNVRWDQKLTPPAHVLTPYRVLTTFTPDAILSPKSIFDETFLAKWTKNSEALIFLELMRYGLDLESVAWKAWKTWKAWGTCCRLIQSSSDIEVLQSKVYIIKFSTC